MGIGHQRFENSGSVLGRHPVEVTQETGVFPRRRRAAIGTPFECSWLRVAVPADRFLLDERGIKRSNKTVVIAPRLKIFRAKKNSHMSKQEINILDSFV